MNRSGDRRVQPRDAGPTRPRALAFGMPLDFSEAAAYYGLVSFISVSPRRPPRASADRTRPRPARRQRRPRRQPLHDRPQRPMMRRWETAGIVGAAIAVVCCAALPLAATAVGALTAIALFGVVGAVVVVSIAIALALHLR